MKIVTISSITKFGNSLARSIRSRLKWSKQLRNSVVLHPAKDSADGATIKISVGENKLDKSGMPLSGMARAYEYGSGLHRTRGIKQRYIIQARKKRNLYFVSPGYTTPFIGKQVLHPGVEARPYMVPAIQEIRGRATAELALDIKKNIINEMNVAIKEIRNK